MLSRPSLIKPIKQILKMSRRRAATKKGMEESEESLPTTSAQVQKEVEKSQEDVKVKVSKWEPDNWRDTLENLREMRKDFKAPVDTMGCSKCCDDEADEKTKRFWALVSLMLSSQTKDQVTFDAMSRLKKEGLLPENLIKWETKKLEELLVPVSFYRNKAKFLKQTSQILVDKYNSDIPNTVNELMKLPGVGPKMAHICMNVAWGVVSGIGVDTHVHRITNRLKWTRKPTKDPEKTRIALEEWLPFELWDEINLILVGFGQTICTPVSPKCDACANNAICPSANVKKPKSKGKK
ncbi:endonuclease III-like protein 1 [Phlebotomus papatasi]|uniref:endonuclease III-like protein 1 n=1 Tax=Phlebotomus papatasi TaxID=29031 RepID=UPI00248466B2|nr:endonuclease III-like protein 1 [Phlebotomus papatasi]